MIAVFEHPASMTVAYRLTQCTAFTASHFFAVECAKPSLVIELHKPGHGFIGASFANDLPTYDMNINSTHWIAPLGSR